MLTYHCSPGKVKILADHLAFAAVCGSVVGAAASALAYAGLPVPAGWQQARGQPPPRAESAQEALQAAQASQAKALQSLQSAQAAQALATQRSRSEGLAVWHNPRSLPGRPLYERFVAAWSAVPDKSMRLAFHGSAEANMAAICREGLDPRRRTGQARPSAGAGGGRRTQPLATPLCWL